MPSSYRHTYWLSLERMSIGQFPSMANFFLTVLQITEQDSAAVPSAGSIGRQCRLFFSATQHPLRSLLHGGTVRCSNPPFGRHQRQVTNCTGHWLAIFLLTAAVRAGQHAVSVAALVPHVHPSPPVHTLCLYPCSRPPRARAVFFGAVRQDRRRCPHSPSSMLATTRGAA